MSPQCLGGGERKKIISTTVVIVIDFQGAMVTTACLLLFFDIKCIKRIKYMFVVSFLEKKRKEGNLKEAGAQSKSEAPVPESCRKGCVTG